MSGAAPPGNGSLVGRTGDVDMVIDLVRAAAAGRSGRLLISGEPWVGKTALVRSVCRQTAELAEPDGMVCFMMIFLRAGAGGSTRGSPQRRRGPVAAGLQVGCTGRGGRPMPVGVVTGPVVSPLCGCAGEGRQAGSGPARWRRVAAGDGAGVVDPGLCRCPTHDVSAFVGGGQAGAVRGCTTRRPKARSARGSWGGCDRDDAGLVQDSGSSRAGLWPNVGCDGSW